MGSLRPDRLQDRLRSQVESEPEALIPWFIALGLKLTRIGLEAGPQFAMALYAGWRSTLSRAALLDAAEMDTAAASIAAANPLPQWPQAEIEKAIHPTPEQQAKLDILKDAAAHAAGVIAASCPTELPVTPPTRLDAVAKRLDAMLQAAKMVQGPLDDFYASLSNEQKAHFNMVGQPATAQR
jgi:hypothetical protein